MTLLIHPGLHKTGTTWLQERVFTDQRIFNNLMTHEEIFDTFVRPHDFDFDPQAAQSFLEARRARGATGKVDVVSSETLCGNPLTGQRESLSIADRLVKITGQAKILITVRNQVATMKASYIQYVKRGGRKSVAQYLRFKPEPGYYFFDKKQLAYTPFVEHYAGLYGASNVLVLAQEALARYPDRYFSELITFATGKAPEPGIGLPDRSRVGASPPVSGLPLLRFSSHFRRGPLNDDPILPWEWIGSTLAGAAYRWTLGEKRASMELDLAMRAASTGLYGQSNRALQRYCPFDLEELGYEMA
ncbi:hypothetical protein [Qipengyuania sp.]|uniref:hypothetical protein n=1 Tax=Qipengyuania sp. TaxID=2004515 RepID=UPI003736DCBD